MGDMKVVYPNPKPTGNSLWQEKKIKESEA
jgi:hypothetical protein